MEVGAARKSISKQDDPGAVRVEKGLLLVGGKGGDMELSTCIVANP